MKLSKQTIEILANFATLNNGIVIHPGNELKTISIMKRGSAKATIQETIPKKVSIYALPEFLSVLSLFDEPEIEFFDRHLEISVGKNKVTYFYSAENIIMQPPAGEIKLTDAPLYELTLTKGELLQIAKASSIMKFDVIGISKNGVRAFNKKAANSSSNVFKMDVDVTGADVEVKFRIEDLKLIPGDYKIQIGKLFGVFTNVADPNLEYIVALEV